MKFRTRSFLAAALAIGALAVATLPAQAVPNSRVELIRGQGSDSTYDVMQNLDRHFNNTIGCPVIPPPGTVRFDHQCVQGGGFTTPGIPGKKENFDHDVAISFWPLGSSNGVSMLDQQGSPGVARIDYARSSRAPRAGDNTGLQFVAYARDATPWVNFRDEAGSPAAGVSNLTQEQLRNIYLNCSITNWNQIGGANAPIIIWTSQPGSGERATFDANLGSGANSENCIPSQYKDNDLANGNRVIFENDAEPVRSCATDPGGAAGPSCSGNEDLASIYHMGFGAWQASDVHPTRGKAHGADLGAIDGVAPTVATIQQGGGYPFSRFIYNVYRGSTMSNPATPSAKDYMGEKGWICKDQVDHEVNPKTNVNYGQEIEDLILETGFVALPSGPIGGGASGNSKCRLSQPT